jgi:tetratricopeptide (TPR) repeat protein
MQKISRRQRMRLFCDVCDAAHHIHQRGIVHRDLRPDNIFVSADRKPKILDVGVAFIADTDMERTSPYMSPEQARGDAQAIDLRTDVFSLGVILYQLLTDRLPYAVEDDDREELVKVICEVEPAQVGGIDRSLQGDLEAVLLKALHKDPAKRYDSASALADDVRRYLSNRPVRARSHSGPYKLRKLAQRHKVLTGAALTAGILGMTLVAAGAARAWQRAAADGDKIAALSRDLADQKQHAQAFEADLLAAQQLARQQQQAIESARKAAEQQESTTLANLKSTEQSRGLAELELRRAKHAAETADDLSTVLLGTLGVFDSDFAGRHAATAGVILDRCAAEVSDKLAHNPTMRASILDKIGTAYRSAGRPERAAQHLADALATRRETLGPEHADTIRSMNSLALLMFSESRFAEAEPLCRELLDSVRSTSGEDHPKTLTAMSNLAHLLAAQDKHSEAEPLYRQALEGRRRLLGNDHPKTLALTRSLASLLVEVDNSAEAELLYRRALDGTRRALGAGHADTLATMNDLASLLEGQNRIAEAEPLFREAATTARASLPEGHWLTAIAESGLGACLAARGKYDQAEPLLLDAHTVINAVLGENDDLTVRAGKRIARLYEQRDKPVQPEPSGD